MYLKKIRVLISNTEYTYCPNKRGDVYFGILRDHGLFIFTLFIFQKIRKDPKKYVILREKCLK